MPDDCPVDDASRRALRDLARRAEWRGHPGAAGAARDADSLRALGREMQAALARQQDRDPSTWAHQTTERLAAYCLKARPDWTPEQIAELARLRDAAVIALAPAPGESDALPAATPRARASLASLAAKQSRLIALAAVGCVVLIALVLTLPHFFSSSSSQTPTASASTVAPATTTTPTTSPATTPPSASAPTSASASPSTTPAASGPTSSSNAHVTAIQLTNTDYQPGSPPEVYLTYSVTATSANDVYVDITVNGAIPPQLSQSDPVDDSGQTFYKDQTATIDLSQWCGQTVKIAISSGPVTQSTSVPVTGC